MILIELLTELGIHSKKQTYREYSSACPSPACGGGTDRFRIWPYKQGAKCTGAYWCRQCGASGDTIEFCRQFLGLSWEQAVARTGADVSCMDRASAQRPRSTSPLVQVAQPPTTWMSQAQKLVRAAHEQIWSMPDILSGLAARGINKDAIHTYQIGFKTDEHFYDRSDWGLSQELSAQGKPKKLWIPNGIVIPTLEPKGDVLRIKIRRSNWHADDQLPKYVAVSGSSLGLTVIRSCDYLQATALIVVESELDAYAVAVAVGPYAMVVAVGSNIKNPDYYTNYLAQEARSLLICHDNDDAGLAMLVKWVRLYPHAKGYPTPMGKDIGEAVVMGLDLKSWIIGAL